jgi:hypothetical protein
MASWDGTPCISVDIQRRLGGIYYLLHQGETKDTQQEEGDKQKGSSPKRR